MATQEVTGRQIKDGDITNADIATSAGIAASKLDFSAHARCLVYRTSAQSISNVTETAITFPSGSASEEFDVGGMHDLSTNTSRLTVPSGQDGYYIIGANYSFAGNSTGQRICALKKNGSSYLLEQAITNNGSNGFESNVSTIVQLSAGDYVELYVLQDSGGSLNTQSGRLSTALWAMRVL